MHVPAPGRVQYYKAECLPFLPAEVKTQIKFPQAFAISRPNLKYLDIIRAETLAFMSKNIKSNYFDGSEKVDLDVSLGEAEVLFSASDEVKNLSESGQLKTMHENVASLSEASESAYISVKDRLMNIINAGHAKEDEIFETLMEDYQMDGIRKHNVFGDSIFDVIGFTYKMASVENLGILAAAIHNAEDGKEALQELEAKLAALLGSKVLALEQLVELHKAYIEHVENDEANQKLLRDLELDYKRCEGSFSRF